MMKKSLKLLTVAGIFTLICMGFSTQPTAGDPTLTKYTIVKGQVYNYDRDKGWDLVTFGIDGKLDEDSYIYVNLLDRHGNFLCTVNEFRTYKTNGICWYAVNLDSFGLKQDFYLEIHVAGIVSAGTLSATSLASGIVKNGAPIDPEETVIIVKYP
jgi:hypothetical protein